MVLPGIVRNGPKNVEIITDPSRVYLASKRIRRKYKKQRQKGSLKKENKKVSRLAKKSRVPRN